MLQSVRNRQTLEILKKMRSSGVPPKNDMINSSGEMDAGAVPQDENLNDIGFEVPGSALNKNKKPKKKAPLDNLGEAEDLAETVNY